MDAPTTASLQNRYALLQKAIQTREYRILKQEREEERLLRWQEGDAPAREMPVSAVIGRLRTAASNTRIVLLDRPIGRAGLVLVGTEGWAGSSSFLYFQFKVVGRAVPRWRWVGCSPAERRDRGGDSLLGEEEAKLLPGLLKDLREVLASGDFAPLKRYVPDGEMYFYTACGPGGPEPREWNFDEMAGMLQESGQGEIVFNPYPDIRAWSGNRTYVSIDTEGWASEYPFLTFTFSRKGEEDEWRWEGVCYDVLPPLQEGASDDREYFSRPMLPRPGPRIFSTDTALRARIAEIIRFGELDALTAYAVKGSLVFGECSAETLDTGTPVGKTLPAGQVVEILKKNFPGGREITATQMSHATFYEAGGWWGTYPYVQFWFSGGPDAWQFTGVTYCKKQQYDLPADGGSWFKKVLKKIFQ